MQRMCACWGCCCCRCCFRDLRPRRLLRLPLPHSTSPRRLRYEIIKKAAPADEHGDGGESAADKLKRADSLWSMKRGTSMRLKQWGSWIAYEDRNVNAVFWYNHSTKASSYEKPKEVEELEAKAAKKALGGGKKKGSMRLKKRGEWIQYVTALLLLPLLRTR